MSTLDTVALAKLIKNHRLEETRAALDAFFAAPMSLEDRGAAQFAITAAYLEFQTEVNQTYASLLADALKRLKEMNTYEQTARDEIDLARVHAEINNLQS